MKTLDSKASSGGSRSRRDRFNITNLTKALEQIEKRYTNQKVIKGRRETPSFKVQGNRNKIARTKSDP